MRAVRAVGAVMSGVLALGLGASSSAAASDASDDARPDVGRLSLAQLRALADSIDRDAAFGAEGRAAPSGPRRLDVVTDPRGDADQDGGSRRAARPYDRLADLTRVRYRTPSTEGGDLRVTTRWAHLVDGSRRGTRHQTQITIVHSPREDGLWAIEVTNVDDRVRVSAIGADGNTRVRPEKVAVERIHGPGGTTDVVLSGEWIDARRVGFFTYGYAGHITSLDPTDDSRPLVVGPVTR